MAVDEAGLKKLLASDNIKRVYLLYGDDGKLISSYRARVLKLAAPDGVPESIAFSDLDIGELEEKLTTVPFMGEGRAVSVERIAESSLKEGDIKWLAQVLGHIDDSATLVLSCIAGEFDPQKNARARQLAGAVEKVGVAVNLSHRRQSDLARVARERCERRGCTLSVDDSRALVLRCGEDLSTLMSECDKLCLYVGQGVITQAVIDRVASRVGEGDIYALGRMLVAGDQKRLLSEIDALIALRQPVLTILSNLGLAVCDIARAGLGRAFGRSVRDVSADFKYRYEFRVKNAFRQSEDLDYKRALAICGVLSDADIAIKSGAPDRVTLETAVIRCLGIARGERI